MASLRPSAEMNLAPFLRYDWPRGLRAGPAIVEILGIWNTYTVVGSILTIELEQDRAPSKGLISILMSVAKQSQRALQTADIDCESFIIALNKTLLVIGTVNETLEGARGDVDLKVAREKIEAIHPVLDRRLDRLKEAGSGTKGAFEDWLNSIATGIEDVTRIYGEFGRLLVCEIKIKLSCSVENSTQVKGLYLMLIRIPYHEDVTQKNSKLKGGSGYLAVHEISTVGSILQQLVTLQNNVCALDGFFATLYAFVGETATSHQEEFQGLGKSCDLIIRLYRDTTNRGQPSQIKKDFLLSWTSVLGMSGVYRDFSYDYILPGLEKVSGLVQSIPKKGYVEDPRAIYSVDPMEWSREHMEKYRCDAQMAITEKIEKGKISTWEEMKRLYPDLKDTSPLNPRRPVPVKGFELLNISSS
ncbi:hypothetical protein TWF730_001644 [Orbilia blumenaviensis]|uniref:Uncharacterized protein n=1 Tax=Orbilia blumenaviensis TaxID=1796055 RepID=A0AAV9UMQ9_9PEZI